MNVQNDLTTEFELNLILFALYIIALHRTEHALNIYKYPQRITQYKSCKRRAIISDNDNDYSCCQGREHGFENRPRERVDLSNRI